MAFRWERKIEEFNLWIQKLSDGETSQGQWIESLIGFHLMIFCKYFLYHQVFTFFIERCSRWSDGVIEINGGGVHMGSINWDFMM